MAWGASTVNSPPSGNSGHKKPGTPSAHKNASRGAGRRKAISQGTHKADTAAPLKAASMKEFAESLNAVDAALTGVGPRAGGQAGEPGKKKLSEALVKAEAAFNKAANFDGKWNNQTKKFDHTKEFSALWTRLGEAKKKSYRYLVVPGSPSFANSRKPETEISTVGAGNARTVVDKATISLAKADGNGPAVEVKGDQIIIHVRATGGLRARVKLTSGGKTIEAISSVIVGQHDGITPRSDGTGIATVVFSKNQIRSLGLDPDNIQIEALLTGSGTYGDQPIKLKGSAGSEIRETGTFINGTYAKTQPTG